jgi:hypothetical protein
MVWDEGVVAVLADLIERLVDEAVAGERKALRAVVGEIPHWKNHVIIGMPIVDGSCERCVLDAALDAREKP